MASYQWAVIGAGPAWIVAVGQLIDHGVAEPDILWLDPYFQVGDFGRLWGNVPSNTQVKLFLKFLQSTKSFSFAKAPKDFLINSFDQKDTCELQHVADPLQWVTEKFRQSVATEQAQVTELACADNEWQLATTAGHFSARQVILATGATSKSLMLSPQKTLALEVALDRNKLAAAVQENQTIGVFGSSHSAVLILRALVEIGVKKIINFYLQPLRYALYLPTGILFDNTGLKGRAATWAKQHLDGKLPANLSRVYSNSQNINHYLPQCDQVIYAVGFKQRLQPFISGFDRIHYEPHTGIIAPGLFGVGIGFPEIRVDSFGVEEARVGLWKFYDYLHRVMPIWLEYKY